MAYIDRQHIRDAKRAEAFVQWMTWSKYRGAGKPFYPRFASTCGLCGRDLRADDPKDQGLVAHFRDMGVCHRGCISVKLEDEQPDWTPTPEQAAEIQAYKEARRQRRNRRARERRAALK